MTTLKVIQTLEKAAGVEPGTKHGDLKELSRDEIKDYVKWLKIQSPGVWTFIIPRESKDKLGIL